MIIKSDLLSDLEATDLSLTKACQKEEWPPRLLSDPERNDKTELSGQ